MQSSGGVANFASTARGRGGFQRDTNVDEDGWVQGAPSMTRTQLEKVQPTLRDPFGVGTGQGMAAAPPMRYQQSSSYPSPAESGLGSPRAGSNVLNSNGQSMQMPPPLPTSNHSTYSESARSPNGSNKRIKLSPRAETFARNPNRIYPSSSYGPSDPDDSIRPPYQPRTPTFFPPHLSNPLTPTASSTASDDLHQKWMRRPSPKVVQDNEVRRVSVNSLLSGSPEPPETRPRIIARSRTASVSTTSSALIGAGTSFHRRTHSASQTETYGLDRGLPDLDLPKNNDTAAISGVSPSEHSELDAWLNDYVDAGMTEFGFALPKRETVFAKGGYYASPVPIKIPRKLEPLPLMLLENPMNLLYFHHFLNHTARILVPHDCIENPFKTTLPQSRHPQSIATHRFVY